MNVVLDVESFLQPAGIYKKSIEDLFESEIFFLGRESIQVTFFVKFMADDSSCIALHKLRSCKCHFHSLQRISEQL